MKLGKDLPDTDSPCPGVLLRGDPSNRATHPRKHKGWTYVNMQQLQDFFPFSMKPLIAGCTESGFI
jgi:hypothetical protein